ncbi:bifunctional GNAT family N-acetyltransferase/acetate--CoA ligase family protein [Amycolatopsis taiwanensis]|uniref:Acyl-CoA synthetase n=1 Tax=Amycolatopsis taiwanensis TaxID=342230 RepID=A0A9W6VGH9_9PSEU|nr:bifunctional GNAT family N-acetyltransferase/acetate--CoA ligase family protein [Amycolatopsis taiwanensis]GLY67790.1 acyl-CoA synthetase [Amycolatopsis taiwanensis]
MTAERAASVVLADGEVVRVRTLRPADTEEVLALHTGLGERDRYLRFFGPATAGMAALAARVAAETGVGHAAVGAFRGDRLIGVAHYEIVADPTEAEVALAVDGRVQAHGVGTVLLEYLVSIARRYGIRRLIGSVLAENSRMLALFNDLGLPFRTTPGGPERQFVLSLEVGEPYRAALSERERVADVASLSAVLKPASVAVAGASRRPGAVGHAVLRNILEGGYTGKVFAVNPNATEVLGVPCVPSVTDLADPPELVVVCVPAPAVPAVIVQSGQAGARAAVIVTAGLTGTDAGRQVVEAARRYGMRLVGPNCVGVANTDVAVALNATFMPGRVPAGHVGVVSQSGGFGIALLESLRQLGIGVSSMVSTGDKYDISGNDLLMWWQRDPGTEIAVLYLESFGNPRKFGRLARSLAHEKPVAAIRTGSTEIAQRAAASHTAAAATPAVTRDALYEQAGVIAVDTITELVDVIAALSWQPLPAGNRVAIISNAGGAGVLAADACVRVGLTVPELGEKALSGLRDLLPGQASVGNPVDTTAAVGAPVFGECLDVLLADDGVDAVIAATVPIATGDPVIALKEPAPGGKPVLAVRFGALGHAAPLTGPAGEVVTVAYADPAGAATALGHLARYAAWRARPAGAVPDLPGIDSRRALALVGNRPAGWLDPAETTQLLDCFGIPVVPSRFTRDPGAAAEAFRELGGPVAVKASVEGLVHKSEAGGVVLDVRDETEVRATVEGWRARFGDRWRGALVQRMCPRGRELLVGIAGDEVFGPLIVFGLGGVDTDLVGDRAARLAPLSDADADLLLHGLRSSAELFRRDHLDVAAIRDVLLRVSRLAEVLPEVAELDLNPLVATETGAIVLDARVRIEPREPADEFLRRLRT